MKGSVTPEPETASVFVAESSMPMESTSVEHDGCRRWQIEVEEAESIASTLALDGTVVVTDDGWGIAEHSAHASRHVSRLSESDSRLVFGMYLASPRRSPHRGDPAKPEHIESITTSLSTMNVNA